MSLTKLCACAVMALVLRTPAESADLYFLSYVRFGNSSPRGGQVTVLLYRLSDSKLSIVPLTSPPPARTDFVLTDQEMRLIVLGHTVEMPLPFSVLSMDQPGQSYSSDLSMPGWMPLCEFLSRHPNSGGMLAFHLFDFDAVTHGRTPDALRIRAFDLSTKKWADGTAAPFRYLQVSGGAGGYERVGSTIVGLKQSETGQLTTIGDSTSSIGPPLPVPLRFTPREGPTLFLSDSDFAAVAEHTIVRGRVMVPYRILNKSTNSWSQLDIPGNASWNVRAFGPWLAAIIDESTHDLPFRLSPGRHELVFRAPTDTVDLYLYAESIYRTGRLLLYNAANRRVIEWDTHDGDCEIILVEDDIVYYRVDQTIYRAKIGEKQLGTPERVVEGPAVPGIHWAFFGPSVVVGKQ